MGDPETGTGQIFQQVGRYLQRWEQAQTIDSDSPDWLSSSGLPGETDLSSNPFTSKKNVTRRSFNSNLSQYLDGA